MPSTIVDLTGSVPRLLRVGVIPPDRLREVIPLVADEAYTPDPGVRPDPVIPDEAGAPDSAPGVSGSDPGPAGSVAGVPGEPDEADGAAAELTADRNGAAPGAPG